MRSKHRKTYLSKYTPAQMDWSDVWRCLCIFLEFDDISGTDVAKKMQHLKVAFKDLIRCADEDVAAARFWCTTAAGWRWWYDLPADAPEKVNPPKYLFKGVSEPERARDFLTCPPLSGGKCARLFNGESPKNEYEKYVAQCPKSRQAELERAEADGPDKMLVFRISALRGLNETRVVAKRKIKLGNKCGFNLYDLGVCLSGASKDDLSEVVFHFVQHRKNAKGAENVSTTHL